jgi:hypothetical protein
MFACVLNGVWPIAKRKENILSLAMNWIGIRYANARVHTKGVCSVLSFVHLSFTYISIHKHILATVQFNSEYEEGEKK